MEETKTEEKKDDYLPGVAGIGSFVIGEMERFGYIGVLQRDGSCRLVVGSAEWKRAMDFRRRIEAEVAVYIRRLTKPQ